MPRETGTLFDRQTKKVEGGSPLYEEGTDIVVLAVPERVKHTGAVDLVVTVRARDIHNPHFLRIITAAPVLSADVTFHSEPPVTETLRLRGESQKPIGFQGRIRDLSIPLVPYSVLVRSPKTEVRP